MEEKKTPGRPNFSEIEKVSLLEAIDSTKKLLNKKHSSTVTNKKRRVENAQMTFCVRTQRNLDKVYITYILWVCSV